MAATASGHDLRLHLDAIRAAARVIDSYRDDDALVPLCCRVIRSHVAWIAAALDPGVVPGPSSASPTR